MVPFVSEYLSFVLEFRGWGLEFGCVIWGEKRGEREEGRGEK